MKTQNLQKQKGFTLVEIAIVLVIIGLLLGGVLKGQELIENTKIKAVKTDSDGLVAAIHGYQDRFRAIPGDDAAAVANVVGTLATTPAGGVGDGTVDGLFNSATVTDESYLIFQHLRLAGFIAGDPADVTPQPQNSFGGITGVTTTAAGANGLAICQTGLTPNQMTLVDTRYDDGAVGTGVIRGTADAAGAVDAAYDASTFALCIIY